MIFLRTNWPNFVYKVTFYSMSWFADQRSGCDQQYLPERRSGSKIFAGTAFRRVPAPLHPWREGTKSHKMLYFDYIGPWGRHPEADWCKNWHTCLLVAHQGVIEMSNFCRKIFRDFISTGVNISIPISYCFVEIFWKGWCVVVYNNVLLMLLLK